MNTAVLLFILLLVPPRSLPAAHGECRVSRRTNDQPTGSSLGHPYGNGRLWVGVWPEGSVVFKRGGPGRIHPDGSLSMKFPWWRAVRGRLTISGRRTDAEAKTLTARIPDGYGEIGFQSTMITFPSEGCWEVTGQAGDASLTFVTRVVRLR